MIPLAGTASPFIWLPFIGYLLGVAAAVWAVLRESGSGESDRSEDQRPDLS